MLAIPIINQFLRKSISQMERLIQFPEINNSSLSTILPRNYTLGQLICLLRHVLDLVGGVWTCATYGWEHQECKGECISVYIRLWPLPTLSVSAETRWSLLIVVSSERTPRYDFLAIRSNTCTPCSVQTTNIPTSASPVNIGVASFVWQISERVYLWRSICRFHANSSVSVLFLHRLLWISSCSSRYYSSVFWCTSRYSVCCFS